jgi:hypothetical protein
MSRLSPSGSARRVAAPYRRRRRSRNSGIGSSGGREPFDRLRVGLARGKYLAWHHFSSMVACPRSVDGRLPWVVQRRTNIGCPHDRALSRSRSAVRLGGSVAQPKLTESMEHRAGSPRRAAFLSWIMSSALSLPSALCSKAPLAAAVPHRLGSRAGWYWCEPRELDQRSL